MTSEGNSALLPANVDRRPPLQQGLMNFQLQNFQLFNKSHKDWSLWKQSILFPQESHCFPRVQSFTKYLMFHFKWYFLKRCTKPVMLLVCLRSVWLASKNNNTFAIAVTLFCIFVKDEMRKLNYEEGKEEMLTAKRCVVTV